MPERDDWWVDHTNLDEKTKALLRRRHCGGPLGSRVFFAIFLIGVGVVLFLYNIGLIPVRNIWDYWPVILIAAGIGRLSSTRETGARLIGLFLVLIGAVVLLMTLGIVHIHTRDGSWPIALLLIAFGAAMLIKTLERDAARKQPFGFAAPAPPGTINSLSDFTVFGGIKRKLETADFQGGVILNVFGGVEIDLRRCQISAPEKAVTLEIRSVFSGTKIRVPEAWKVTIVGVSVMGAYEDKTIPPNTGPNAPSLVITGFSVFSSVEIEN